MHSCRAMRTIEFDITCLCSKYWYVLYENKSNAATVVYNYSFYHRSMLARATYPYESWPDIYSTKDESAKQKRQHNYTFTPSSGGGIAFSRSLRLAYRLEDQVYNTLLFSFNARTTNCARAPVKSIFERWVALDECICKLAFYRTLAKRMHCPDI